MPEFEDMRAFEKKATDITAEIRGMVDALGSYQSTETGQYAIKQRKESLTYKPELVHQILNTDVCRLVIVESVDKVKLEGLVKGGLVKPEDARACAEVKEIFAFIIK